MKKFLLVAVAAGFALSFGSCKKDYTCTCTTTATGSTTGVTQAISIPKTTKKKATDACDAMKSSSTVNGSGITTDCHL